MEIPQYVEQEAPDHEYYNELLNSTLRSNLSDNGWVVPTITDDNLRVNTFLWDDGTTRTVADFMPVGTIWFVGDATPPAFVGKTVAGLIKFTNSPYP